MLPTSDTSLGSVFDTNRRFVGDDGVDMISALFKIRSQKKPSLLPASYPFRHRILLLSRQKKFNMLLRWTLIILFIKIVLFVLGAAAAAVVAKAIFAYIVVMATATDFHRAGISRTSCLRLS